MAEPPVRAALLFTLKQFRMGKTRLLFVLTCVMALSSCSEDIPLDEKEGGRPSAISLTATVSSSLSTRASHSDSRYTTPSVVPGDVGVHFEAVGSTTAQSIYADAYTYSPSGSNLILKTGSQPYFPNTSTGQVKVTAWYPRSASQNGTISNFTVSTDQSSSSGYTASDLMTATAMASSTTTAGKTIPLVFKHQMAQLQVSFINKTSTSAITPAITVTGVYLDQNCTTKGNVIVTRTGSGMTKYDVLVPPQTITSGKTLLTIINGSQRWQYVTAGLLTLKAGNTYPIVCTLTAANASTGENGAGGADPRTADAKAHY